VFAAVFAVLVLLEGVDSPPREAALGEAFRLRLGESARVESEALEVGFRDVLGDSRCPKGEQCIREGEAIVRVWLQKGDEARDTLELRTSPKEAGAAGARGFEVRLLRLDPYPVTGRTLEPGQYVATLELSRGSGASSESR
jgi:hypothetical protein